MSARPGVDMAMCIASRLPSGAALVVAALHDRRVQVEIVRHDCCAQNADGDIEHGGVGDDGWRGHNQIAQDRPIIGAGEEHLRGRRAR